MKVFQNNPTAKNASFALLNVHSLNNKAPFINDVITDRVIDFKSLTETWQEPNEFITLNEAIPPGYEFIDKPCLTGRGGGLAVLYRSCFKVVSVPLQDFSSFECLALKFSGSLPLILLLIYRPPKASSGFYK